MFANTLFRIFLGFARVGLNSALPPDVRRWLCLAVAVAHSTSGCALSSGLGQTWEQGVRDVLVEGAGRTTKGAAQIFRPALRRGTATPHIRRQSRIHSPTAAKPNFSRSQTRFGEDGRYAMPMRFQVTRWQADGEPKIRLLCCDHGYLHGVVSRHVRHSSLSSG